MANTKSAAKRARQTVRRTAANRRVMRAVKSTMKKAREALTAGDKAGAAELSRKATSVLDKAAKSGRIHRNKANRHKAQFSKALAAGK
ncbi:MAG TPA: 30S ribosomal protein S20 [Chthoniobacteraceae bacterium]|nr:30S ribosomal protein S20 [Chthoniobacteraceae bacterium]